MRRWVALVALAAAAWACAILACTGQTSFYLPAVDAGAVDTNAALACSAWARAVCAREGLCRGTDPVEWTSAEQCVGRSTLLCEVVATDPSVDFDAQALTNCAYSMDCTVAVRDLPIDCLPPGRTPPGVPCVFHEACTCGTCAAAPPPCGCPGSQLCVGVAFDGGALCADAAAVGSGCLFPAQCTQSYCDLSAAGHGTCVPFAAQGEACGDGPGSPVGRQGIPCAGVDAYCDSTLKCSLIEGVGYMEPCGAPPDGGPFLACAGYGTCDPSSSTCIEPSPDGEVCDESQGLGCMPPAECIDDRCLYPSLSYCGAL
jgi:hypothetical protein